MKSTRHMADTEWNLHVENNQWDESQIQIAILCDIRRELKKLNAVFACPNFLEVPRTLRSIRRNTAKPRKKKVT